MESDKKKRRSANDLYPVLEKRKNTFYDYAYAGNPETMVEIFKKRDGKKDEREFPESAEDKYFFKIPSHIFKDPIAIDNYAKKLPVAREKRNFSQEKVAELIGIDHDAISKIEGGKLKKIDRNILVLLCGLFQISPEDFLGVNHCERAPRESPMVFDPSDVAGKPQFICNRLIDQEPNLLRALAHLANASKKMQTKLLNFLQNAPKLKIMKSEEATAFVKSALKELFLDAKENCLGLQLFEYINTFGDLGSSNLDLLDAYVSIAAMGEKLYPDILKLLICAGFWAPNR